MAVAATGTTSKGVPYLGNPDYRGYLNYLAQNGDTNAKALLPLVGNDGSFAAGGGSPLNSSTLGANDSFYYNFLTGGGGGGATAAGSGTTDTTASDLAYLDDQDAQLRNQLDHARTAQEQGLTQLDDSFNQTSNRTNQDRASAKANFDTTRTNTTNDKLHAVDNVNTNARTLSDSVRRMIGLASGRNSTAFQITAPQAIATDTTEKRTAVNDTFGRNFKNIDDSEAATNLKFDRFMEDLGLQRKQKEQNLRSGILEQEQGIDQQLGQNALTRSQINGGSYAGTRAALAPFSNSINDRQNKIDSLFNDFRTPFTLQDTSAVAPTLGSYDTKNTTLTSGDNSGASNDPTLSPYLLALQKKFKPAAI